MVVHILSDVREVLLHRRANVHHPQGGPQPLRQHLGVGLGALRGAKAGHGDAEKVGALPAQQIQRPGTDEGGQGGIQSAGESQHSGFCARVRKPLLEAQGRKLQNFLAGGIFLGGIIGQEGIFGDGAGEGGFAGLKLHRVNRGPTSLGLVRHREGVHPPPLVGQLVHINFRNRQPRVETVFRQNCAVFGNEVMPTKDQIGGGLSLPGVGHHIAADAPGGLLLHQLPAALGLPRHLVGSGEVQNEGRALLGQAAGGRVGGPQVLADFHADDQIGHIAIKTLLRPHQGSLPAKLSYIVIHDAARRKPPPLVELPVVGNVGLWNETKDDSLVYHSGAVIQFVIAMHRQPNGGCQVQFLGFRQHRPKRFLRPLDEGGL